MAADLIPITPPADLSESNEPPRLTRVQRQAILALVEYPSVPEAAEAIGKSPRTLQRWLGRPEFRDALDRILEARETAIAAELQTTPTSQSRLSPRSPPTIGPRTARAFRPAVTCSSTASAVWNECEKGRNP
ncbi:MAG: hypothetical protein R2724_03655 [Bryobacterales bacterium]